jgi:uncharacterized membrane protein YeaQ/YmgE (transglycosylase-associated protein family)
VQNHEADGHFCALSQCAAKRIADRETVMPMVTSALLTLIIIVVIGIVAGFAFNRYGRSWWARTVKPGAASDFTAALVGIAGAFIGFHIGVVLQLLPLPLMQYLLAIVGAVVMLWAWRAR